MPYFNDILQLNESEEDNINNLIMPIIDLLYHFDFDENESGCELIDSDVEERENINNESEEEESLGIFSQDNNFYENEIYDSKEKNKELYLKKYLY